MLGAMADAHREDSLGPENVSPNYQDSLVSRLLAFNQYRLYTNYTFHTLVGKYSSQRYLNNCRPHKTNAFSRRPGLAGY